MKFPRSFDCNNWTCKRGNVLHHTGHVVTTKNVWIAKQVSFVNVTVITLIGLYTLMPLIHSVHNNVGVHSFIY